MTVKRTIRVSKKEYSGFRFKASEFRLKAKSALIAIAPITRFLLLIGTNEQKMRLNHTGFLN